jgi:hypothetical protein
MTPPKPSWVLVNEGGFPVRLLFKRLPRRELAPGQRCVRYAPVPTIARFQSKRETRP